MNSMSINITDEGGYKDLHAPQARANEIRPEGIGEGRDLREEWNKPSRGGSIGGGRRHRRCSAQAVVSTRSKDRGI